MMLQPRVNKPIQSQSNGYTLIELLLAMTLFSFALLIIIIGALSLMRVYQRGIAERRALNASRVAVNQIVELGRESLSFTYGGTSGPGTLLNSICMYGPSPTIFYVSGGRLVQQFWDVSSPTCSAGSGQINYITPSDVTVVKLMVEQTENYDNSTGLPLSCFERAKCNTLRVNVTTTTNATGLDSSSSYCKPNSNFCGVATISTTVRGRAQP